MENLDEDSLPDNSDGVLVLSQWLAALTQFKGRHTEYGRWLSSDDLDWEEDDDDEVDD